MGHEMPQHLDLEVYRAVAHALQEEVAHHVASFMLQDLRHAPSSSLCQTSHVTQESGMSVLPAAVLQVDQTKQCATKEAP